MSVPVRVVEPIRAGQTIITPRIEVPGITTGAAYADKDQIGSIFVFPGLTRKGINTGIIQAADYFDLDDEGLQVDLWLYSGPVVLAADNSAHALADSDLIRVVDVIQFTTFYDAANGQFSSVKAIAKPFRTVQGQSLYASAQARGALNIAALNLPQFRLHILAD